MNSNNDFMHGFILGQLIGFCKGLFAGFIFVKFVLPRLLDFIEDHFYGDDYFDEDFDIEQELPEEPELD